MIISADNLLGRPFISPHTPALHIQKHTTVHPSRANQTHIPPALSHESLCLCRASKKTIPSSTGDRGRRQVQSGRLLPSTKAPTEPRSTTD